MAETDPIDQNAGEPETNGKGSSRLSSLLSKNILVPAAATAVTAAAAGFAAKKAPDVKNKITGEAREGAEELGREGAQGAKSAITGGGGGVGGALAGGVSKLMPGKKGAGSKKKTRRLPIQRWTDVAVPVERAYEQWTKFDDFPKFMHRVLNVEQKDDKTIDWQEKIWFSTRRWEGEITDQRKNDRIAWKTVSGTSHSGVVSFHELDDKLTRVLVTVDFQPAGMLEKMASGMRFAKRAVQADLARFKAFVELEDAEGIEYESVPGSSGEDEQEDDKKRDDDKSEQRSESENGAEEQSEEEREEERRERDQRRQERRGALSAS